VRNDDDSSFIPKGLTVSLALWSQQKRKFLHVQHALRANLRVRIPLNKKLGRTSRQQEESREVEMPKQNKRKKETKGL